MRHDQRGRAAVPQEWYRRTLEGLMAAGRLLDSESARSPEGIVAILDLDRFTSITVRHGVRAGDALLRAVEHALHRAVLGRGRTVALGGDQFLVVLPGRCDTAEVACRLLAAVLDARIHRWGRPLRVSASAGLASWHSMGETARDALAGASRALSAAKSAGGNHWADARTLAHVNADGLRAGAMAASGQLRSSPP